MPRWIIEMPDGSRITTTRLERPALGCGEKLIGWVVNENDPESK